jgi:hypothetical protein
VFGAELTEEVGFNQIEEGLGVGDDVASEMLLTGGGLGR